MSKVIVGILPDLKLRTNNDPYCDKYSYGYLYAKRIEQAGGISLGLIADDKKLIPNELLSMCDAFLIQGGTKLESYHFQVIDYAIKNNKPLLGICLGMQAIDVYSVIMDHLSEFNIDDFWNEYNKIKELNNGSLLEKLPEGTNHFNIVDYENYNEARHIVKVVDKDSIIYDIYNKDELSEVSLHSYKIKSIGNNFKETMLSDDNVVEGIEYINKDRFIVGVQYHPEWDSDNLLFNRLIIEGNKRKNG